MDLQQAYYEQRFENLFLKSRGNTFQEFFEKLMGLAYKTDFMACRPWGNRGDRKNDGFLKSEQQLFQVYAPNEMKEAVAIKKITDDFEGAKEHWGLHFNKWAFVHNADDGLPPHVQKVLLDFQEANHGINIESWGMEELRAVFRKVTLEDKQTWLGFAPTAETKMRLGFSDLQPVLESLAIQSVSLNLEVKDVPQGKIEANALSESVTILIKEGMSKADLVRQFFDKWYDLEFGEKIAKAFREQYKSLRKQKLIPNIIFSELQAWTGGEQRGTPEHELAVLTVLAYYFERCDIFKEPGRDK
ncbi:MAG: hypothetical protein BA873_07780 [Desulfobulbaceae bacterium C00003063]|nr:MAG: hypothetical protein BA873_07780 [Desulfobulbaceae bacterium C00003063]